MDIAELLKEQMEEHIIMSFSLEVGLISVPEWFDRK
jgi:hypothetical protein